MIQTPYLGAHSVGVYGEAALCGTAVIKEVTESIQCPKSQFSCVIWDSLRAAITQSSRAICDLLQGKGPVRNQAWSPWAWGLI